MVVATAVVVGIVVARPPEAVAMDVIDPGTTPFGREGDVGWGIRNPDTTGRTLGVADAVFQN